VKSRSFETAISEKTNLDQIKAAVTGYSKTELLKMKFKFFEQMHNVSKQLETLQEISL
jgi:hypothetical protein